MEGYLHPLRLQIYSYDGLYMWRAHVYVYRIRREYIYPVHPILMSVEAYVPIMFISFICMSTNRHNLNPCKSEIHSTYQFTQTLKMEALFHPECW
jgi:hypothetical protein